jgi:hypothetical protein
MGQHNGADRPLRHGESRAAKDEACGFALLLFWESGMNSNFSIAASAGSSELLDLFSDTGVPFRQN